MEKLDISPDTGVNLVGIDVEPEVGSEPALEDVRSCEEGNILTLSGTDVADRIVEEEDGSDIPDLTPATISSDGNGSDGDSDTDYNFKGGICEGRLVDLTGNSEFKANIGHPPVEDSDMVVMKDIVRKDSIDDEDRQQDIASKNDCWESDEGSVDSYVHTCNVVRKDTSGDGKRQQDIIIKNDCWGSDDERSVDSYVYTLEDIFSYERDRTMLTERWESDEELEIGTDVVVNKDDGGIKQKDDTIPDIYGYQDGVSDGFAIYGYKDGMKVEYMEELLDVNVFSFGEGVEVGSDHECEIDCEKDIGSRTDIGKEIYQGPEEEDIYL